MCQDGWVEGLKGHFERVLLLGVHHVGVQFMVRFAFPSIGMGDKSAVSIGSGWTLCVSVRLTVWLR